MVLGKGGDVVELRNEGALLIILLNRPDAANALNRQMLDQLGEALHRASEPKYRGVVLGGKGRNFSAGSDLKAAVADPASMDLRTFFNPVMLTLSRLEKPVVAAVNGAAAGGGLSLALAADMRVMADTARLVPSWLPMGLVADLGASWHLARMLGAGRAFGWLATGEPMSSQSALAAGLANQVVANGSELEAAIALANRVASVPGPGVALTRQLLATATMQGLSEQLEAEGEAQARAMRAPEQIAALAARVAQLEKASGDR